MAEGCVRIGEPERVLSTPAGLCTPTLDEREGMSHDSTPAHISYKPVDGFPDYRVGDDGSVWSCRIKGHRAIVGHWKRLTVYRRPYGCRYCVIGLRALPGGRLRAFYVHRLVLEAFVGPCPPGQTACHNDGDTANNALGNLRWDTRTENMADKKKHGTATAGMTNAGAKLSDAAVVTI